MFSMEACEAVMRQEYQRRLGLNGQWGTSFV